MTPNKFKMLYFCILTQKVLIRLLPYLYKWYVRCEPRWDQSDYWSNPSPPQGPHNSQKCNIFHIMAHMKCSLLFIVFPYFTYVSSVMRSSWHSWYPCNQLTVPPALSKMKKKYRHTEKHDGSAMIIEGPPMPPNIYKKLTMWSIYMKNQLICVIVVHNKISSRQYTDQFCDEMFLPQNFGVNFILKISWVLEAYIYQCLWVPLSPVYWFRLGRPWDTFAVAGDRTI